MDRVNLTDLASARAARERRRLAELSVVALTHPALRWWAGDDRGTAHRRTPAGRTGCGADGMLRTADSTTPLCEVCYRLPAPE